jgi:hypothetical protein
LIHPLFYTNTGFLYLAFVIEVPAEKISDLFDSASKPVYNLRLS